MTVNIRPVPTPVPQASDPVNFDARADAFHSAFPGIVADMNDQNAENNALNVLVNARLVQAEAAALAALSNAQLAAGSAGAQPWVSGIYAPGASVWSPLNGRVYRRVGAAGMSSTDPADRSSAAAIAEGANWRDVAMDISTGLPTVRPSLLMDLAAAAQLDPRVAFSRASSGWRSGPGGLVLSTPANIPRFDFDPISRACRGLLLEGASTNLFTNSEGFGSLSGVVASGNVAVAPDGASTADRLAANTGLSFHGDTRAFTVTAGTVHTVSRFVKAEGLGFCSLTMSSDGFGSTTKDVFDLINGQVVLNQSATATIRPFGNGWFLVSSTRTATASANTGFSLGVEQDAAGTLFAGNGVDGILVWGSMLSSGPSSYIPTAGATVTRAADLAALSGANFSAWHRADEGSLLIDASVLAAGSSGALIALNDNTANNQIALQLDGGQVRLVVTTGGVQQVNLLAGAVPAPNTPFRVAAAYRAGDFAVSLNGAVPVVSTSGTLPTRNQARLGALGAGTDHMRGHLRRVAFYPARLSSGQLQALSAL